MPEKTGVTCAVHVGREGSGAWARGTVLRAGAFVGLKVQPELKVRVISYARSHLVFLHHVSGGEKSFWTLCCRWIDWGSEAEIICFFSKSHDLYVASPKPVLNYSSFLSLLRIFNSSGSYSRWFGLLGAVLDICGDMLCCLDDRWHYWYVVRQGQGCKVSMNSPYKNRVRGGPTFPRPAGSWEEWLSCASALIGACKAALHEGWRQPERGTSPVLMGHSRNQALPGTWCQGPNCQGSGLRVLCMFFLSIVSVAPLDQLYFGNMCPLPLCPCAKALHGALGSFVIGCPWTLILVLPLSWAGPKLPWALGSLYLVIRGVKWDRAWAGSTWTHFCSTLPSFLPSASFFQLKEDSRLLTVTAPFLNRRSVFSMRKSFLLQLSLFKTKINKCAPTFLGVDCF